MELVNVKQTPAIAPVQTDHLVEDVRAEVRSAFDAAIIAHDQEWVQGTERLRSHIFRKRRELMHNVAQWLQDAYEVETDGQDPD